MTEAEKIVAWARSQIGSTAYKKRCQAFVADAYVKGTGKARQSKSTAALAEAAWKVSTSKDNIPIAAAVYFSGSGSAGHVGIYSGNGKVIHAFPTIMETSIAAAGTYHGWGWNGGSAYRPEGSDVEVAQSSVTTGSTGSTETATTKATVDITSVAIKSVTGTGGSSRYSGLRSVSTGNECGAELLIKNNLIYAPILVGDITLTQERFGSAATLKFDAVKDAALNFQEGSPVSLRYNGKNVFYGYVFTKKRTDNQTITVTAYDQLRYFKNEDTINYTNKSYSELVKMLADDYGLICGELEDTGYTISSRIEECSLFEMCGNASDLTVINTGRLFVLYDDYGEICLKSLENMRTNIAFCEDNCEEFSYSSTIDDNTYNKIKLATDNDETGEREVYISQDGDSQSQWGVLQYYEKISDGSADTLKQRADVLLKYYNVKQRSLKLSGCPGDASVRGGSLVFVRLDLGDIAVSNYMLVESAKHKFSSGRYTMDLTLSGVRGEFVV